MFRSAVGFGLLFFVPGPCKFMMKLVDRMCFGVQGPRGLDWVPFFVSGLFQFMGKLASKFFCVSWAHWGWVWIAVPCIWLLKICNKNSRENILFGVQGPRGLGLGPVLCV